MNNINFSKLTDIISDIENEMSVFKKVIESTIEDGAIEYVPMLVFYSDKDTKQIVVAPKYQESFDEKILRIAEALHLYVTLSSSAVTVSMVNQIVHDNTTYDCLNIYILSESHAFNILLPFTISDNSVTWFDHLAELTGVDEQVLDETGKDVITMFYSFTHIDVTPFSSSEILSYLSSTGAAIHQLNTNIEYYNIISVS